MYAHTYIKPTIVHTKVKVGMLSWAHGIMGDSFLLCIGVTGFFEMSIYYLCNKKKNTSEKDKQMPAQMEYVEIMSPWKESIPRK